MLQEFTDYNLLKFTNRPLFVTLKNNTLKDILVKSKHSPTAEDSKTIISQTKVCNNFNELIFSIPKEKSPAKPGSCKRPRCATCQHFNSSSYFQSTATKQQCRVKQSFSCSSTNIIYLITCSKCHKQYVGKTSKTLRERVFHHRSSIKNNQARYICKHFNLPGHSLANFKIQVIDRKENATDLQNQEEHWIKLLDTLHPKGLNVTSLY
uniref:GIY-YIG domain-containing protein n=1 Tax=Amphimedon queenslandica TaxID=400682 RepID=A0A1X7SPB1_AMPQE